MNTRQTKILITSIVYLLSLVVFFTILERTRYNKMALYGAFIIGWTIPIFAAINLQKEEFEIEPNTIMGGYDDPQSEWQI